MRAERTEYDIESEARAAVNSSMLSVLVASVSKCRNVDSNSSSCAGVS